MRFVADENISAAVIQRLRLAGHDVLAAQDIGRGSPDPILLPAAASGSALLITEDKDFGELVFRTGAASGGVILVRMRGIAPEMKAETVAQVVREHGEELRAAFAVISPGRVRIRPSPSER